MADYGVTTTGFSKKTLDVILSEVEASMRAALGPSIDLLPPSVLGTLLSVQAERESLLWELGEALYDAQYPDTASGVSLDNVVALTGLTRLGASYSTVTVTATGLAGSVIPAGRVFSVVATGARFVSIETQTIGAGGTVDIRCQSQDLGPVQALSGTLTVIETPTAGLTSVTNALDASLGRNVETDAELRIRRFNSLEKAGSATIDAIRAKLLNVAGVTAATIIENSLSVPDSSGRPAKSYESLVLGGADADILQTIWDSKPAGIQTYGNVTGTINDTMGFAHTVNFSRPNQIPIYVVANVTADTRFPADGATQVQNAIVSYGNTLVVDQDVYVWLVAGALANIAGIQSVDIRIGTAPAPTGTANLTIGVTEIAKFDTSRITVNVTHV